MTTMNQTTYANVLSSRAAKNPINIETIMDAMRGHYGALSPMIMEIADNSSSNYELHRVGGNIRIRIFRIGDGLVRVTITDDGTGIEDIDAALALGNRQGKKTALNGWGHGIKNIPGWDIVVRTTNAKGSFMVVGPLVEGVQIQECERFSDLPHGTEVSFTIEEKMLVASNRRWGSKDGKGRISKFFTLVQCVVEDIGLVHGMRMQKLGYSIVVEACDGCETVEFKVKPLVPVIAPFSRLDESICASRKTMGTKQIPAFNGDGLITLEYCVGTNETEIDSIKEYFAPNRAHAQGWYIYMNGRFIGKTATLKGTKLHNSENGYMGVVNIIVDYAAQAPRTAIAKTGFVEESPDYNRLLDELYELCPNMDQILNRAKRSKMTERTLNTQWGSRMIAAGDDVEIHGQVPGTADEFDILNYTKGILYENKMKAAQSKNVYQIMEYALAYHYENNGRVPFTKAYLCATDLPAETEIAMTHVNAALADMGLKVKIQFKNIHKMCGDLIP